MDTKLAPYIKPNGIIALAFPGFKKDYHNNLPSELLISWGAEDLDTFHSCKWWHELLSQSQTINIESISELKCMEEAWHDWLECDEEHAINDRASMNAGAGKYMNLIAIKAKKL